VQSHAYFTPTLRLVLFVFSRVSNLSNSATDNQGTNEPRFFVLSLLFLCFGSGFCFVSVSSLFRLSLVCLSFFAPEMLSFVRFSNVLKSGHFLDILSLPFRCLRLNSLSFPSRYPRPKSEVL
jgi:hypothetical protein